MSIIYLDGNRLPGFNYTITASYQLADQDLSGKSSSTLTADDGDKAKSLNVRCSIRMSTPGELRALKNVLEARDGDHERVVYSIINDTAMALDIRRVQPSGAVYVTEGQTLRQWDVSFTLKEFDSVPEKKQVQAVERKTKAKKVAAQAATGAPVTPSASASGSGASASAGSGGSAASDTNLTQFEQTVLKPLNELLK